MGKVERQRPWGGGFLKPHRKKFSFEKSSEPPNVKRITIKRWQVRVSARASYACPIPYRGFMNNSSHIYRAVKWPFVMQNSVATSFSLGKTWNRKISHEIWTQSDANLMVSEFWNRFSNQWRWLYSRTFTVWTFLHRLDLIIYIIFLCTF